MEFIEVESIQWQNDPAWGELAQEKILHRDEETRSYTRLIRTRPGVEGKNILSHDFDEVVYILEGGMINIRNNNIYTPNMVAYFLKGMDHGPFRAPVGAVNLEFRHYKKDPGLGKQLKPGAMEFIDINALEWRDDPVHGPMVKEKILHKDEQTGTYTRIIRVAPGFKGGRKLKHDFDEVVYILKGGMINRESGNVYTSDMVAYFKKGIEHGPFESPVGTLNWEVRHYK
jgi:uncharacterized cupin superfamily protein